jgi:hypothetical protein
VSQFPKAPVDMSSPRPFSGWCMCQYKSQRRLYPRPERDGVIFRFVSRIMVSEVATLV